MRKTMVVWLCLILMVSAIGIIFPTIVNSSESQINSPLYTTHDPIYIDGNADFTFANGVTDGSGTQSDPYIIEDWDISAFLANGIEIRNTDAYFIIRNCYVHDGGSSYNGINFYSVQNGRVENTISSNNWNGINLFSYSSNNDIFNNTVSNNDYGIYLDTSDNNDIFNNTATSNNHRGIYLYGSSNNNVFNNTASNNNYGIYLFVSSNNDIFNNTANSNNNYGIYLRSSNNNVYNNTANSNSWSGIYLYGSSNNNVYNNTANSNNDYGIYLSSSSNNNISNNIASSNDYGIYLSSSSNNTLINNTLENNGIFVDGSTIDHFTTHNIDTTNTANGKPIYYYKNQKDINIDGWSAGQIILANCTNFTIKNMDCSNASVGMQIEHCNECSIENSTFNDGWYGIYLRTSSYITISNNSVSNNSVGIYFWYSIYNDLYNNTANSNNDTGIFLSSSIYNNLYNNTANSNSWSGINLHSSSNSNIYNNTASNNEFGIYLYSSSYNNISNNTANSNNNRGIYLYSSSYNTFIFNKVSYNFWSMEIYDSSCENNIFHHNNFFGDNAVNVADNGVNTRWDDGYGEGNYWSNYYGLDDGSNGRVAGDGVGDTNIPHGGLDNYPLMEPWTPPDTTPPLISSVEVSDITASSAVITWITDENSDSRVNYSINADLSSNSTQYDSTLTTSHSIILTSLNQSTTFYFEVSSTDSYGNTATDTNNSGYYSFTTLEDTTPPATPTGLAVTSLRNGDLNITWSLNTDDTQTYSIYSNKTGNWTLLANVTHPQNWYVDSVLTSGTTYYYKISAWNEVPLESSESGVVHGVSSPIGTISGTVEDKDGNPIYGATVTIYESGTTTNPVGLTTTNSNGEYSIEVPPDTYDVKIEKSDYETQWEKDVEVTADQTTITDLTLPLISPSTADMLSDYWWLILLIIIIIVVIIVTLVVKKKTVKEAEEEMEKVEEEKVEESEIIEEDEAEEEEPS